jgi:hypothetical protein
MSIEIYNVANNVHKLSVTIALHILVAIPPPPNYALEYTTDALKALHSYQ